MKPPQASLPTASRVSYRLPIPPVIRIAAALSPTARKETKQGKKLQDGSDMLTTGNTQHYTARPI